MISERFSSRIEDPGDPETHWHRDDEAISLPQLHRGLRTVHAWIPMRAMGKELGTLRYLLGSHRRETLGAFQAPKQRVELDLGAFRPILECFGGIFLRYTWYEELLAQIWGWEFAWFALSRCLGCL